MFIWHHCAVDIIVNVCYSFLASRNMLSLLLHRQLNLALGNPGKSSFMPLVLLIGITVCWSFSNNLLQLTWWMLRIDCQCARVSLFPFKFFLHYSSDFLCKLLMLSFSYQEAFIDSPHVLYSAFSANLTSFYMISWSFLIIIPTLFNKLSVVDFLNCLLGMSWLIVLRYVFFMP